LAVPEDDRRLGRAVGSSAEASDPELDRGRLEGGSPRAGPLADGAEELRDIQSITDAALSRLDPQAFLDVLVDQVKDVLRADTAAVLLLDHASAQLVATAASGLEEEVRQGVRIPLGRGFAGRVAAQRRPMIVSQVDSTNVVNPILLAKGSRRFTSQDVDLLQLAADRAAVAVQSLTAQLDRAAAVALQRSLVPSALPPADGLEMAARYVPGSGNIGGDWYDVFTLPSGELCAVIGDVAGTGLKAAVIMGRIRSALRAYALETTDPADVLSRLEIKMRHFEPDTMATVLYAVFDKSLDQVRISSAGHLPPVIVYPGQPAVTAEVPSDILLGITAQKPRRVTTVGFPPGALLCLYTDGLVERRGVPIDDGIARLCAAVTAGEPEAACASVMGAMADAAAPSDDIALLLLRRLPAGRTGAGQDPRPGG